MGTIKLDAAAKAHETLVHECSDILGDEADLTVPAATRLRHIRDRKTIYVRDEERIAIASQSKSEDREILTITRGLKISGRLRLLTRSGRYRR